VTSARTLLIDADIIAYSPGTIEAVGGNDDEDGENISFQNNQANGRECAGNVTVGTR
jgi:hypothetical protein